MPISDFSHPAFSKTGQVKKRRYLIGIFAGLSLMMAGCSNSDNTQADAQADAPVDQLYNDALNTALAGDADLAAPKFEEVERQPFHHIQQ